MSCTRLQILLNTICRKPGFNSLRTPLNHGAGQASNETLKQTQQRNWSNASQGGQTALKEHVAVLHYETASTTQQPRGEHKGTIRIARLQAPLRGNDKVIIHSPHVCIAVCWGLHSDFCLQNVAVNLRIYKSLHSKCFNSCICCNWRWLSL